MEHNQTASDNKRRLISLPEAAELYGFHSEYLSTLVRKGRLDGLKVGGRWITTPQDVENFIRSRQKRGVYRADIQLDCE
ncbi:MAG: helix-turn-helix domain-containing protein [Candidatus Promineifilaceae bacterium]